MKKSSDLIFERACKVFPGGVNSPMRAFRGLMRAPLVIESGKGAWIRDADGKEYIDFCCSWGALILGHAHPVIVDAVCKQAAKGSSFGITMEVEAELAEKIISFMPSIEKLRFVNSGTEATMTALRLARGYTGRSKVVKFNGHYHGHSDALLIQAGSGVANLNPIATSQGVSAPVIADTLCIPFNDEEAISSTFHRYKDQIAAVILEPVTANHGVCVPPVEFLEFLRKKTLQEGALLIFDEVVTGFRLGLGGAQEMFGIDPDLTCLGKIMGGGFPAAAVGGKARIMDYLAPLGQVYQAGTLSGNPIAMRAGLETLKILSAPNFYENLAKKTSRIRRSAQLDGCGSMFNFFATDPETFVKFFNFMLDEGVYISPSWNETNFLSAAHTEEQVDQTVELITRFVREEIPVASLLSATRP